MAESVYIALRNITPSSGASAGKMKAILGLEIDGEVRSIWLDHEVLVSKLTRGLKRRDRRRAQFQAA